VTPERQKARPHWQGLLAAGATGLGALPPRAAYALADVASLGVLAWSAMHEQRVGPRGRGVERNQRIVYREAFDSRAAARQRRDWARHLSRLVADVAALRALSPAALAQRVDLRGLERLRPLLAEGRGLIAVSGHIGVWELLTQLPSLCGIPLRVVARPTGSAPLDLLLDGLRQRGGARVVAQRGALWQLTRALAQGEAVGLLADENRCSRPLFAPFLGTPAATNPAPARLQQRTGAPIAVVSCHRCGIGRFRLDVWDVLRPRPVGADPQQVVRAMNAALSRAIQAQPEQWLWGSRRFHTRPPGETPDPDGLPPRAALA